MSKIYYIGNLSENKSKNEKIFKVIYSKYMDISNLDRNTLKLSKADFNYLKAELQYWADNYSIITDEKFIKTLKESDFSFYKPKDSTHTLIFEIVKDEDGFSYAREILTQKLFPLCHDEEINYRYNFNNDYKLDAIYTYKNPKISKFSYAFELYKIATQNEVNEYIAKNTKKSKIAKHIKLVTRYYNENVFKENIILKEDKELEKQDEITKLMEEIEFELSILKHYYKDLYDEFLKEYKNLCNENNLVKPQKTDFIKLLSKIKFDLTLKEDNIKDLNEYLNLTIEDYFNKLINNIELKKELNIDDIDNLAEYILKNKEKYNINDQRRYLTKISLLYLLVIKDSNNINEDDLNNGYFKDNIKTIIYNITTLKDFGLIFNEFSVYELKDTSITNVLNLIKKIEFDKSNIAKTKLLTKEN